MCPKKISSVTYKKSMLDSAVEAVMSGTFTMKQSASVYGVPVASISNTLKKKGYSSKKKKEVDQLTQIDKQLLDWLRLMSEISCFSLRNQMGDIINEVFERFGQKVKLDGKTGQMQWIDRFVERQPEVLKASLEAESGVSGISSEHIDEWTRKLQNHLLHAHNIEVQEFAQQSNAGNIFCCFEVGSVYFSGNKRSFRLIYKPSLGHVDGEFIMSLYSCICADGTFLKPVAIVKDETLIQTTIETGVRDFHILSSSEGKMSCEAAMLWMQLIDVEIQPKKGRSSFLIFLDQTVRPLSLATLDFCRQRQLILFYLPGHYPNMKLPFGMDIFYNLNGEYDSILSSDDAKDGEATVESALELLMEAWKMMLKTNSNVTEFHDFGLVPLDSGVMKSTVEEIVPLTMSPTEVASEAQDGADTPASSAHIPNTPTDASSSSYLPNASQQSNEDTGANLPLVRPSRIPPKNYKESSETDIEADEPDGSFPASSVMTGPASENKHLSGHAAAIKKPNLKIKIKRSERLPNTFSVEPEGAVSNKLPDAGDDEISSKRKSSSESSSSCDQCDKARDHGLRSGVVQGLVFALKRIESSLRADTLNLYKSRYLSPYLNDHRPSEPSFVMWCELLKCLEMGPDAVQKDFLLARSIQNHSNLETNGRDCGSTNSYKSGSCLSDATSDVSVQPQRSSKNKKRTLSPCLQERENFCVSFQNCFTQSDSSSFPNTAKEMISSFRNINEPSRLKADEHKRYSGQTEHHNSAVGQAHRVSGRDILDYNNNNEHLNTTVHYPYKAFTQATNGDMKNKGGEACGSFHSGARIHCNNKESLDGSSASVHRGDMFAIGHQETHMQKLEPHSLQAQFRPPQNVAPQTISSSQQRLQFDRPPTLFSQPPQAGTSTELSMQHHQFQREQPQHDPYPLLNKSVQSQQSQKLGHPTQSNEPRESYESASHHQRLYEHLHHQERRDSPNASMLSKYNVQTGSSGFRSSNAHSENVIQASQRAGDVSQDSVVEDPAALACKSKIPGHHSFQQSCTPKKNMTSPNVTSTPKSAEIQMPHITPTPASASQVQRPQPSAAQSIDLSQSFVNNLNGNNHDGGTMHHQTNHQQNTRPHPSQCETPDHPVSSHNQTGFSYSRSGPLSRPAMMPPPTNLSSAAHNLNEDSSSQLCVRGSEPHESGLKQENVPRYQAQPSGNSCGDFNRSSFYSFSGQIQPSSTSSQVSSHHTFASTSYGPGSSQTLSTYHQAMPQTVGGYSGGYQPHSNELSHPPDFHSVYQFSGMQQHQPHHHSHLQQHQQHQLHPPTQHIQIQKQLAQNQHMPAPSNEAHMPTTGHSAALAASRVVDVGLSTSDIKVEQYTNL